MRHEQEAVGVLGRRVEAAKRGVEGDEDDERGDDGGYDGGDDDDNDENDEDDEEDGVELRQIDDPRDDLRRSFVM